MAPKTYDAIVVGSGMAGGWAAKELTEHGLRTLVLEAGRDIIPERDYVEHVAPWQMHFRDMGDRKALDREQPIQKECYACDEMGSRFFVNDIENPYVQAAGTDFKWIRGRWAGARSCGGGKCTAGATSTSRRISATATASIGRSVTPTSRPGTRTWSASLA
jgi:choline dehydrogenase-like flavoprotein